MPVRLPHKPRFVAFFVVGMEALAVFPPPLYGARRMPPEFFHFSAWGWAIAAVGALFVGLGKGGLTGLGIAPVLIFALILPPRESTGFVLPLLIVGDLCAVGAFWRAVKWPVLFRLFFPALLGVFLGYLCMGRIAPAAFGPLIGAILLGLIAIQLVRKLVGERLDRFFQSTVFSLFMGILAGMTTMIANAAGPVAVLYFLSIRLLKWELIATSAWLFFLTNLCKVPFSVHLGLINPNSLYLGLFLAPAVVAGIFIGRKAASLIPQREFNLFVLAFSLLGALRLIWAG